MRVLYVLALLCMLPASSYAQRLSPAEAVAVLRGSHSIADLTDARFGDRGTGPHIFVVNSSPTAGPFGEFKPLPATEPLSRGPYVFRVPRTCHGCDDTFVGNFRQDNSPRREQKQSRPRRATDRQE